MYEVHLSQNVDKFLNRLDKHIRNRIEIRLKRLAKIHVPSDANFIGRDELGKKIFRYILKIIRNRTF